MKGCFTDLRYFLQRKTQLFTVIIKKQKIFGSKLSFNNIKKFSLNILVIGKTTSAGRIGTTKDCVLRYDKPWSQQELSQSF